MIELLRKDIGLCRNVLIIGLVCLFAPFLAYAIYALNASGLSSEHSIELWSLGLLGGASISVMLSVVTVALLTGYVVAGERRDRTAEFLAYLPPSRNKILLSKLLLCVGWVFFAAAIQIGVVDFLVPIISQNKYVTTGDQGRPLLIGAVIIIFGSSWLGTCVFESPTLAVLLGLISPCLAYIAVVIAQLQFGWFDSDGLNDQLLLMLFIGVGVSAFVLGWVCFVKRFEP